MKIKHNKNMKIYEEYMSEQDRKMRNTPEAKQ